MIDLAGDLWFIFAMFCLCLSVGFLIDAEVQERRYRDARLYIDWIEDRDAREREFYVNPRPSLQDQYAAYKSLLNGRSLEGEGAQ